MALDLDAIRRKVQQLNGTLKKSRVQFWRPDTTATGTYEFNIRILPWANNDGQPFRERWFYYGIGKNPGLLAPTQFQKADPVQELIDKLHSTGKKEDKEICKKLYPKMRAFAPILVRGSEDQGVLVWSFGKEIYQRLLEFFLDGEIGDITDVNEGYDLKVKIVKKEGKPWPDTTVDAARKPSKLYNDPAKIDEALANVPNMDEYQKLKSYDELKSIIEAWARGEDNPPPPATGPESTRTSGEPVKDELEKLSEEIAESKKSEDKPRPPSSRKVKAAEPATELVATKVTDLDSVFDEIMDS